MGKTLGERDIQVFVMILLKTGRKERQFRASVEQPTWEVLYLEGGSTVARVSRWKGDTCKRGREHFTDDSGQQV